MISNSSGRRVEEGEARGNQSRKMGHKAETRKWTAALKNTQDQLKTKRLLFQKEKTSLEEKKEKSRASFLAQLEEEKRKRIVEHKEYINH